MESMVAIRIVALSRITPPLSVVWRVSCQGSLVPATALLVGFTRAGVLLPMVMVTSVPGLRAALRLQVMVGGLKVYEPQLAPVVIILLDCRLLKAKVEALGLALFVPVPGKVTTTFPDEATPVMVVKERVCLAVIGTITGSPQ